MKKLISRIRYKLACWHRKRFQKLMAKCLGATRYYLKTKTQLSSLYGIQVTNLESFKKAFNSGVSSMDNSSIYSDTDSVR